MNQPTRTDSKFGEFSKMLQPEDCMLFHRNPEQWTFKIQSHHLAWAATSTDHEPFPFDIGSGSSIDHLCGQKMCHRKEHLSLAAQHRTNIMRINCPGILLLVHEDEIVQESPCNHAFVEEITSLESLLLNSCKKVSIQRIDDQTAAIISQRWTHILSTALMRTSSLSIPSG